ncbi:MAG: hypothetical protein ACFCUJ_06530 [Thiotrichales bacterium]
MDWIFFGDDWAGHASTTQHLVRALPSEDRVLWINSIGMRSPRFNLRDLRRIVTKLAQGRRERDADDTVAAATRDVTVLAPRVVPFHLNRQAQRYNRALLGREIANASAQLGLRNPVLATVSPVVDLYLEAIPHQHLVYLRLDDYGRLNGVDPALIEATEPTLMKHADLVVATAKALMPSTTRRGDALYLPQGVDTAHFGQVSLRPPRQRILGFFGLIAEWIDFDLIRAVAKAAPDWTLEFIGPVRYKPAAMNGLANVRWKPAVSYAQLPSAIRDWSCAWIPMVVNPLTDAVNPLKAREYLAAGLPTHSVPLPEVRDLCTSTDISLETDPLAIVAWMEREFEADGEARRFARRASVAAHGWPMRSQLLRQRVAGL